MGKEMGNSNTTELQEDENGSTQVQEKSEQEAGPADGKGVENPDTLLAEVEDYCKKENGVASDGVPNGAADPHVTSLQREEKETEVQLFAKSPKVEVISNNSTGDNDESYEMKPNYVPNESQDYEKLPINADGAEGKEYLENVVNDLSSSVREADDPHIVNQITDVTETEDHSLAESSKSQIESKNAENEAGDIQPTSSSTLSEDHELEQEPNLVKNLQQFSDNQLEKQSSIKQEEEGIKSSTSETGSASHGSGSQEYEGSKFDQPELAHILADLQDNSGSVHRHEDILGSSLDCNCDDNSHSMGTKVSEDLDGAIVFGSIPEVEMDKDDSTVNDTSVEEEEVSCEGRLENKDGDDESPVSTDSIKAESYATSMNESLDPDIEVSENCVVVAAETILIEKESKDSKAKASGFRAQCCEESLQESKTASVNLSKPELMVTESEREDQEKRTEDFTYCGSNKGFVEEAKIAEIPESCYLGDGHKTNHNEPSLESRDYSQKKAEMVPESETESTEPPLTDGRSEEMSEERQIIEEIVVEEKTEASYGIGNDIEESASERQCKFPPEGEEQDNSELNQENNGEVHVPDATEVAIVEPEQNPPLHRANTTAAVAEANTQASSASQQYDDGQESLGRLSTESNSQNSNTQAQMQKSPSFGLDLRIEARTEESDRTPLLDQDKTTAAEDFTGEQDIRLGSPIAHAQHDQAKLQYQPMPVEEKSKTPCLNLSKEEEEARTIFTPHEHDDSSATAAAAKKTEEEATASSKEKRKPRSSLFTTCLCCTSVFN